MSGPRLLTADRADGRLFAYVVPDAHHVEPSVSGSRFAAILSPFSDEEAARRALTDAGGENVRGGQ